MFEKVLVYIQNGKGYEYEKKTYLLTFIIKFEMLFCLLKHR